MISVKEKIAINSSDSQEIFDQTENRKKRREPKSNRRNRFRCNLCVSIDRSNRWMCARFKSRLNWWKSILTSAKMIAKLVQHIRTFGLSEAFDKMISSCASLNYKISNFTERIRRSVQTKRWQIHINHFRKRQKCMTKHIQNERQILRESASVHRQQFIFSSFARQITQSRRRRYRRHRHSSTSRSYGSS